MSSELPISPEGGEAPERERGRKGLALVGVLTVIKEEFDEISPMLKTTQNIPNTPYYVRNVNAEDAYEVVLRNLGDRGNDTSTSRTVALIEDFRPDYLLLVGIAGGVGGRDGTALGDVIVPDFIDGYEMRKYVGGDKSKLERFAGPILSALGWNKISRGLAAMSSGNKKRSKARDQPGFRLVRNIAEPIGVSGVWTKHIHQNRRPGEDNGVPKVILGPLIFGEKILGNAENESQREILEEFDNAVAVDMESGGVALAVYEARITRHYNPQYLVIRGISDLTNAEHNNETRGQWKPYAAHVAGAFALEVVETLIAHR